METYTVLMLVQYKIGIKIREMGEVKQSGMLEERKRIRCSTSLYGFKSLPKCV
jgi:hypothetical protein